MVKRIEQDYSRFRQIVKGKIRKDLRKFMSHNDLIGKQGKRFISIPVPEINIPHFRYNYKQMEGVAKGSGKEKEGDVIGIDQEGLSAGGAGSAPGTHMLEVEISFEELAEILQEELELPRIQPKGKDILEAERGRYISISLCGPEVLRHFKRTFKEALKREIALGIYDPKDPLIIPVREDKRYRTQKSRLVRQNAAVVFFMLDVSGSMGGEQKEIVRLVTFWIDLWLRRHYKKMEIRYICHDAEAKEVNHDVFYHIKESGGTKISSAFKLCKKIIDSTYPVEDWNIYGFYFSDGDNWGQEDTEKCIEILESILLQKLNLFAYCQVKSPYGSGQFLNDLKNNIQNYENFASTEIGEKSEILDVIKLFLGKGK